MNETKLMGVLCVLFLLSGCSVDEQFKVGIIAPLSGNQAFIGNDFREGAVLKEIELNNEIALLIQDSLGTDAGAVSAYHQLMLQNPDVIIQVSTGARPVIELAKNDKMPLMLTVASEKGLAAESEYVFRYFTHAELDAPVIAEYAVKNLSLKTFGILYLMDKFAGDYSDVFSLTIEKNGAAVIGKESFQYTDYDYRSQLFKLAKNNPDAIYLIGLDYQLAEAMKEIKELGINSTILSLGTIATDYAIGLAEGSADGIYCTAFCVDSTPEGYKQKFTAKYGKNPGFFSELGYDMVNFIDIADGDGSVTKDEFIKSLVSLKDIQSNTGLVSSDAEGELIMPVCPKLIKDGKILNLVTGNYYNG